MIGDKKLDVPVFSISDYANTSSRTTLLYEILPNTYEEG